MRFSYFIILTMLIGNAGLLGGCGQKGPLFLPPAQDDTARQVEKDKADKKTPQKNYN